MPDCGDRGFIVLIIFGMILAGGLSRGCNIETRRSNYLQAIKNDLQENGYNIYENTEPKGSPLYLRGFVIRNSSEKYDTLGILKYKSSWPFAQPVYEPRFMDAKAESIVSYHNAEIERR